MLVTRVRRASTHTGGLTAICKPLGQPNHRGGEGRARKQCSGPMFAVARPGWGELHQPATHVASQEDGPDDDVPDPPTVRGL